MKNIIVLLLLVVKNKKNSNFLQSSADYDSLELNVTLLLVLLLEKEKDESYGLMKRILSFCKEHGTKTIKSYSDNICPILNELLVFLFINARNHVLKINKAYHSFIKN